MQQQQQQPAAAPAALLTIRDLARECGTRVHRVRYAVAEHNIEPRQRAGIVRLWSRDQIPAVRAALVLVVRNRMAAHRRLLAVHA